MKMLDLDTETTFPKKYMETAWGVLCVHTIGQKWSFFHSFCVLFYLPREKQYIVCVYYNRGKALLEPPAIVVNLTFSDISLRKENQISYPNFLILFRLYF